MLSWCRSTTTLEILDVRRVRRELQRNTTIIAWRHAACDIYIYIYADLFIYVLYLWRNQVCTVPTRAENEGLKQPPPGGPGGGGPFPVTPTGKFQTPPGGSHKPRITAEKMGHGGRNGKPLLEVLIPPTTIYGSYQPSHTEVWGPLFPIQIGKADPLFIILIHPRSPRRASASAKQAQSTLGWRPAFALFPASL